MLHAEATRTISQRARAVHPSITRTVADIAGANGLAIKGQGNGRQYTTCPQCSGHRSAAGAKLKCLSVLIDSDGVR